MIVFMQHEGVEFVKGIMSNGFDVVLKCIRW
jgi:hypothetical protein